MSTKVFMSVFLILIFLPTTSCYRSKNCSRETVIVTGMERASGRVLIIGKSASIGKDSYYVLFNCQHGQFKAYCDSKKIRNIKVGTVCLSFIILSEV